VQALAGWPLLLQFPRLYLLLLFFVILIKVSGTGLRFKPFIAFFVLLLLADAGKMFAHTDNSRYLFKEKLPLVYGYAIKDDKLVYYYWDEKGRQEALTGYSVQQHATSDVRIQNNQVFYKDQQLTGTPDRKKQVMLIDGKDVIYLSDKNRGFGFYTLRSVACP
jgi:hypothetical protein